MACLATSYIHHIDVYQGKNKAEVEITDDAKQLPTTMKAAVNLVLHLNIANNPNGARLIAMDNRYQCPELAVLLRKQYQILSTGMTN